MLSIMQTVQSAQLFEALKIAQSLDFSQQTAQLLAYVNHSSEMIKGLDRASALPIQTAAMLAQSLAAWHQNRAAGAPRNDGPFQETYQSVSYQGGDSLNLTRFMSGFHITPDKFDQTMLAAVNAQLEPIGVSVRALSANPRYANDGPPEFKRMGRPSTTTYCQISAEVNI